MKYSKLEMRKFAENHLKLFFSELDELIVKKKIKFDLILGAGNSGVGMIKLVKIFYRERKLKCPKTLNVPFYRSWHDIDRNYLLEKVKYQLKNKKIRKVLFVDDEIGSGETFKSVANMVVDALKSKSEIEFYILAETKRMKKTFRIKNSKVKFIPFTERIERGVYNVISKCIPNKINLEINKARLEKLDSFEKFNILLNEPVKSLRNKKPYFSMKLNKIANEKIPGIKRMRKKFRKYIESFIH